MVIVPNHSLEAFVAFISGIMACVAYGWLGEEKRAELWFAITIFTTTSIAMGLHALQNIKERPTELRGKNQAIIGIVLCLASGLGTVIPLVIIEVSKFLRQLGVN